MKPRTNRIQHFSPPFEDFKIQGAPLFYSDLTNASLFHLVLLHTGEAKTPPYSSAHKLPSETPRRKKDTKITSVILTNKIFCVPIEGVLCCASRIDLNA
jgi:hypothetical protein